MIHYSIEADNSQNHFLKIEMEIAKIDKDILEIQLPAWRPGRYELQHFARNIQKFEIFDEKGKPVIFKKILKDRWTVETRGLDKIKLFLTYYANVQNAGSSYVDEKTLYVNFVNCLPYAEGRMDEPCLVNLKIPGNFQIACGLEQIKEKQLFAKDYYELVDSPLLASPLLVHEKYQVGEVNFFIWFLGDYAVNWEKVKSDFLKFTEVQIAMMGDFPEKDYHFINWILPTPYYHGVEHKNSTMIVLGPDSEGEGLYSDLLGVSSHELFHTWNICKIRPVEMLPYNFTRENYFPTGFVAEGVTTYYGDLFLKRSGVFSLEDYIKELGTILKRHFEQDGRAFQSLIESSFDLWLDGYAPAIPDRRVSIYQKGAVVALILDLTIRFKTNHEKSLDDVMQMMWERFGKKTKGYSLQDYQIISEEVYGESLDYYFDNCIAGNKPLEEELNSLLKKTGLWININEEGKISLEVTDPENENLKKWLN
ncbi:Predicted metalloprotease, contains C-terminal PDZ domain [Pseudarcicella hirudinis]|uniref:Predicted metalloprotease, contains C-terminal PDZ domain n=1 Tax=Pseudarcicella hirudinis TaxID=1079859 RepID=A0A1I5WT55_9BACT|nr:M61 family peptidase [Pseudarcicella hirudinis]SFQ22738.1 Predicted metalloprotease, contains C-terminal PDZ domain [Pseudarcicella hirudinis]